MELAKLWQASQIVRYFNAKTTGAFVYASEFVPPSYCLLFCLFTFLWDY